MFKADVPIVVVAYNRPKSLKRLLGSLSKAYYPSNKIKLIISIDASEDNQDVLKVAQDFEWTYGKKIIIYQETNLGLREHILKCGNYSIEYGSVIILEDDLFVSPNFYNYVESSLSFSLDKEYIGGISLYNHQLNVHTGDNFSALEDGYENWYFQFASSWGQAWTSNQWSSFMVWYKKMGSLEPNPKIPKNVTDWSDKSWLKYFIAYLIEAEKYFFCPKISLSTNFSDAGTHIGNDSTKFQVPMIFSKSSYGNFSELKKSDCVYDSFYENEGLHSYLDIKKVELSVDLYGIKPITKKRYLLTNKILEYKVLKTFGKSLKPVDSNIKENIDGHDLLLYDTSIAAKNPYKKNKKREISYNIKSLTYRKAVYFATQMVIDRVKIFLRLY